MQSTQTVNALHMHLCFVQHLPLHPTHLPSPACARQFDLTDNLMRFLKRQQQLRHLTVGRYRLTHACMGNMARVGVEAGAA